MRVFWPILVAQLAACGFNPHPQSGALPCDHVCPSGYHCGIDRTCSKIGLGEDAPSLRDSRAGDVTVADVPTADAPSFDADAAAPNPSDSRTGETALADTPTADAGRSDADVGVDVRSAGIESGVVPDTPPAFGGEGGAGGTGGSGGSTGIRPLDAAATGGVAGSGGVGGRGGNVMIGGANGSGGIIGTGGLIGPGGTTGTGGMMGTGGTVGSGGTVGAGGNIGSGGTVATGGVAATGGSTAGQDASADGSSSDSDSSSLPNTMFVTSVSYTGDLGGLAGADQKCQARAQAAGLGGNYIAFLSTSTTPALSRFGDSRGWIRTDGRPFADTQGDIAAGSIFYPPRMDEFGHDVPVGVAFSGTGPGGIPNTGYIGNDWGPLEGDGGDQWCTTGSVTAGATSWYDAYLESCSDQCRLYCFGIDRQATVLPQKPQGPTRVAFVSAAQFNPSTGRDGADGICTIEASQAGLSGSFLALLATSSQSAISRFNVTGPPWIRPDGVYVVAAAADIGSGELLAPIVLGADGSQILWNSATGASAPGSSGSSTCNNWTSSSSTDYEDYGDSYESDERWFTGGSPGYPCSVLGLHVYCLEQ